MWLAPALFLVGFFIVWPIGQVIIDSFTNKTLNDVTGRGDFIGLTNYRLVVQDDQFWHSFRNNLILLISVPASIVIGLGVTAILYRSIRGTRVYELLIFIPFLPAVAAVSIIFIYIMSPDGPFNLGLMLVGLDHFAIPWRSHVTWSIYSIVMIMTWKSLSFVVLLFTARMLSIDRELFESAAVDGASWTKTFWHVALPQMRGIIQFAAVIRFIEVFSFTFAYIYVYTFRGGPIRATWNLEFYLFQKMFTDLNAGLASAVAVFLLIVAAGVAVYRVTLSRQEIAG